MAQAEIPSIAGTKGGSGVWQKIISEMPFHRVYIEPFWGRGTIAKKKRPAEVTIGCDLDPDAISSGKDLATMFKVDGMQWVADYFAPAHKTFSPQVAPTFCGAAWEDHFVYFDPPYLGCSGYYKFELTDEQHLDLCWLFRSLPCPSAISGYHSDLYDAELGDLRSIEIPTVNRAGNRCTEVVWFNYDEPRRYHDVRFVGNGRRERERIKRRVTNWAAGLMRMDARERQAVFEACAAGYDGVAGNDAESSDGGSKDAKDD